jgi:hypothetical protein
VAHVNGDGKLDLVASNGYSNTFSVLLGKGNGTFWTPLSFGTGGLDPHGLAVADINGDGKPDIVVSNNYSSNVSVLAGLGNGTFQRPVSFATYSYPFLLAVADLNGDGKPDLAITADSATFAGAVSVLLNTSTPAVPSTVSAGSQLAAGNSPGVLQAGGPITVLLVCGTPGNTSGVLTASGIATAQPADNMAVRGAIGPALASRHHRGSGAVLSTAGRTGDGAPPWLGQDTA